MLNYNFDPSYSSRRNQRRYDTSYITTPVPNRYQRPTSPFVWVLMMGFFFVIFASFQTPRNPVAQNAPTSNQATEMNAIALAK